MGPEGEHRSPLPAVVGELVAEPSSIGSLLEGVGRFASARRLGARDDKRLRVVVEELATNSIAHGKPAAGATLSVALDYAPGVVTITYVDRCRPFDPRRLQIGDLHAGRVPRAEGGQGWRIILSWCRIVDYRRDADCNRLVLAMPLEE